MTIRKRHRPHPHAPVGFHKSMDALLGKNDRMFSSSLEKLETLAYEREFLLQLKHWAQGKEHKTGEVITEVHDAIYCMSMVLSGEKGGS